MQEKEMRRGVSFTEQAHVHLWEGEMAGKASNGSLFRMGCTVY